MTRRATRASRPPRSLVAGPCAEAHPTKEGAAPLVLSAMSTRVAFIGLGIMGLPMAGHLLAAGHELRVHTRTKGKAEGLLAKGATWADTPKVATERAEVVFVCVTDTPDVRDVLLGDAGVMAAARA